jgi:Ca2+-binding EF-hand superfamily protein
MATVQEERLEQRFRLWDNDGDGDVDKADWESEANEILSNLDVDPASPKGSAVKDSYSQMWEYLAGAAGVGTDGALDLDAFKAVVEAEMLKDGNAGFANVLRPTITAIVQVLDVNGDNQISPNEFTGWLKAVGVPDTDADSAFAAIDTNGNGYLSIDELVNAVRDFHAGTLDVPLLGS